MKKCLVWWVRFGHWSMSFCSAVTDNVTSQNQDCSRCQRWQKTDQKGSVCGFRTWRSPEISAGRGVTPCLDGLRCTGDLERCCLTLSYILALLHICSWSFVFIFSALSFLFCLCRRCWLSIFISQFFNSSLLVPWGTSSFPGQYTWISDRGMLLRHQSTRTLVLSINNANEIC